MSVQKYLVIYELQKKCNNCGSVSPNGKLSQIVYATSSEEAMSKAQRVSPESSRLIRTVTNKNTLVVLDIKQIDP